MPHPRFSWAHAEGRWQSRQRLHVEYLSVNAVAYCLHAVFLCDTHAKTKQRLHTAEALFNAGRDSEHIHLLVEPMQPTLSQHEDSQKLPYALGQTL